MNIKMFLKKLAEALTIEVVVADKAMQEAYLEVVKKKWPRWSRLEELLDATSRKKFFKQDIWAGVEAHILSANRNSNFPQLIDQPSRMYFEIIDGEEYGLTSSIIGEMNKHVVPKLLEKVNEELVGKDDEQVFDVLIRVIGDELVCVIDEIHQFRSDITDRISVKLFS